MGLCSATRKGSRVVGAGLCTSVTASRMTDAYGAGTLPGCPQSDESDKSDKSDKSDVLPKYTKL